MTVKKDANLNRASVQVSLFVCEILGDLATYTAKNFWDQTISL